MNAGKLSMFFIFIAALLTPSSRTYQAPGQELETNSHDWVHRRLTSHQLAHRDLGSTTCVKAPPQSTSQGPGVSTQIHALEVTLYHRPSTPELGPVTRIQAAPQLTPHRTLAIMTELSFPNIHVGTLCSLILASTVSRLMTLTTWQKVCSPLFTHSFLCVYTVFKYIRFKISQDPLYVGEAKPTLGARGYLPSGYIVSLL